jgi:hypothetical protein
MIQACGHVREGDIHLLLAYVYLKNGVIGHQMWLGSVAADAFLFLEISDRLL